MKIPAVFLLVGLLLLGSENLLALACSGPTISAQPQDIAACPGASVSLSVSASGTGTLTYEWRKGRVPLAGGDGATLTINPLSEADWGTYSCVIRDDCGVVTTRTVTLGRGTGPAITTQPQDDQVCLGFDTGFFIAASGDDLSYQWRKNCVPIPGATNAFYPITAITGDDLGSYDCVVWNACGSLTSETRSLTQSVNDLTVTSHPTNAQVCAGATVVFSASATGTGPISYQWRKNNVAIPGETGPSLVLTNVSVDDVSLFYDCQIVNACGLTYTDPASLSLLTQPSIVTQPEGAFACPGQNVLFSVVPGGSGPHSFQWRKGGVDLPGENSNNLSILDLTQDDFGDYDCVITNVCGSVTTQIAALEIGRSTLLQQPVDVLACPGETVTYEVMPEGSGPFSYQWRKDCVPLPGTNSPTLTLDMVTEEDTGSYSCVVTSSCGVVTSRAGALLLREGLSITQQPTFENACSGAFTRATVTADGPLPITYQWRKNGVDISGAVFPTLFLPNLTAGDEASYVCAVSANCGTLLTEPAVFQLDDPVTILLQPTPEIVCEDETLTLSVIAAGTGPFTYSWLRNGQEVVGQDEATLTIENFSRGQTGNYACIVRNNCGGKASITAAVSLGLECQSTMPDPALGPAVVAATWVDDQGETRFVDLNRDGHLTQDEADAVTGTLDISGQGIENLEGLDLFRNITGLNASFNRFTQWPDLSGFPNLETLDLSGNDFSSPVAKRGAPPFPNTLQTLGLAKTRLRTIPDLSNLTHLHTLTIANNYLTSIQPLIDLYGLGDAPDETIDVRNNLLAGTTLVHAGACNGVQTMLDLTDTSGATYLFSPQRDFSEFVAWAVHPVLPVTVQDFLQDGLDVNLTCQPTRKRSAR